MNRSEHSLLPNWSFRSLFDWLLWHFGIILNQLQQSSVLVFIQHLPCFSAMPLESISRKYSRLLYPPRTQSVQCSRLREFTRKKKQLCKASQTQLRAALFLQPSLHRYRSPACCGCLLSSQQKVSHDEPLPPIASASYNGMLCFQLPIGVMTNYTQTVVKQIQTEIECLVCFTLEKQIFNVHYVLHRIEL